MGIERVAGRAAVVTGGGRGIGASVARTLAAAGASVVVTARSGGDVEAVAASIRSSGGRAWSMACDVTDEAAVAAMAAEAEDRLGHVDILVNNAGVAASAPLHQATLEEWDRLMKVNATSAFLCTRAFIEPMVERGWGRVVNVASVAGLHGARYIAAYTASKHAMVGLTRAAAAEVAGRGVTVNAICPGYVDTAMTDASVARIMEKTGRTEEEARAAILQASPLGRLLTPSEVAAAVLYLCWDASAGVNGQALVMDGGALQA
jgi:3-hydroxybutyrate dehydrogenase